MLPGDLSFIVNDQDIPVNSTSHNPNDWVHLSILSDVTMENAEHVATYHPAEQQQQGSFSQQSHGAGQDPSVPPNPQPAKVGYASYRVSRPF
jgi:hypothetical protein